MSYGGLCICINFNLIINYVFYLATNAAHPFLKKLLTSCIKTRIAKKGKIERVQKANLSSSNQSSHNTATVKL